MLTLFANCNRGKMKNLNFNSTNTKYAKAERLDIEKVLEQNSTFQNADLIDEVFSKIPLMFQILNQERQIVYINELLKENLESKGMRYSLGYRPGEILQCRNAFVEEAGCGTSANCRFCNIINCILDAIKYDSLQTRDVIFDSLIDKKQETTNYVVSAKPFYWKNEKYIIVSFENVSEKKKKEQLERTFFHDLMNKVNSIYGLSEILNDDVSLQDNQFISMIKRGIFDLVDEIKFQHSLVNAEKDELVISYDDLNSGLLLKQIKEDFTPYEINENKSIKISKETQLLKFKNDAVLLKRCLTNLVKNALEAIQKGETIEIASTKVGDNIRFSVKNNIVLSEEIKSKIFKRTFSTKGKGRGIGTYSIRLFTEKYMGGKAYFTSTQTSGTTFYLEYPLNS